MKKIKWAGLLLAFVMVVTVFTGCLGNFYTKAATIEGEEIPAGLYLMMQMMAYNEASGKVEDTEADVLSQRIPVEEEGEEAEEDAQSAPTAASAPESTPAASGSDANSNSETPEEPAETIPAVDWINNRTDEMLREYVVVQKLAAENEVVLSEEGQQTVEQNLQYWPMLEEYYAANGIGEETVHKYLENIALRQDLFNFYYDEGGERAPSREEIEAFAYEDTTHLYGFEVSFTSDDGAVQIGKPAEADTLLSEAYAKLENGEATIEALGAQYYERVQAIVDQQLQTQSGDAAADDQTDGDTASYMQDWMISHTDATGEYTPEFLEKIKNAQVGDVGRYEGANFEMLYEVVPLFRNDEEYEERRGTIVGQMKSEEFEDFIKTTAEGYTAEYVTGARWYLSPKKIRENS